MRIKCPRKFRPSPWILPVFVLLCETALDVKASVVTPRVTVSNCQLAGLLVL